MAGMMPVIRGIEMKKDTALVLKEFSVQWERLVYE